MVSSPASQAFTGVLHHTGRGRALALGARRAVHARRRGTLCDGRALLAAVGGLVARVAITLERVHADVNALGKRLVAVVARFLVARVG